MIEYSLIIKTDKYPGNFDTELLYALFGVEDDRLRTLPMELIQEWRNTKDLVQMHILTQRPVDEYGDVYYKVLSGNSLEFFIETYYDYDEIVEAVTTLKDAIGSSVTLFDFKGNPYQVEILIYSIKTVVSTITIDEI